MNSLYKSELSLEPMTLTVDEAAAILRIGRGSAYALVRSGRLRSIKIGRRILIPASAIEDFLRAA